MMAGAVAGTCTAQMVVAQQTAGPAPNAPVVTTGSRSGTSPAPGGVSGATTSTAGRSPIVIVPGALPVAGCVTPSDPAIDDRPLPAGARALLDRYAQAWADAAREIADRLAHERDDLIRNLQDMQDEETRAGHLDEAVAIRAHIRQLQAESDADRTAPATLTAAMPCTSSPWLVTVEPPTPTVPTPRTPTAPSSPQAPATPTRR